MHRLIPHPNNDNVCLNESTLASKWLRMVSIWPHPLFMWSHLRVHTIAPCRAMIAPLVSTRWSGSNLLSGMLCGNLVSTSYLSPCMPITRKQLVYFVDVDLTSFNHGSVNSCFRQSRYRQSWYHQSDIDIVDTDQAITRTNRDSNLPFSGPETRSQWSSRTIATKYPDDWVWRLPRQITNHKRSTSHQDHQKSVTRSTTSTWGDHRSTSSHEIGVPSAVCVQVGGLLITSVVFWSPLWHEASSLH